MSLFLIVSFLLTGFVLAALPAEFTLDKNGVVTVEDCSLQLQYYNASWKMSGQYHFRIQKTERTPDLFRLKADWPIGAAGSEAQISIAEDGVNAIKYDFKLAMNQPSETKLLCLSAQLPVGKRNLTVDGRSLILPEKFEKLTVQPGMKVKTLQIQLRSGGQLKIDGDFTLSIQDNRSFQNNSFSIRIMANPAGGIIKNSSLALKIALNMPSSTELDLRKKANMGFRDAVGGDGRGGWTDQGPENDLSALKTFGLQRFMGLRFQIIDPAKNNGKSCIVLGAPARKHFPQAVELEVPPGVSGKTLQLLHSAAWIPAGRRPFGKVQINYGNGSSQQFEIVSGVDVGNWWAPGNLPNATVGWSGANSSCFVGLYLTQFKLERDDPRSVCFTVTDPQGAWMIAAVSLGTQIMTLREADTPRYIVAGAEYVPLEFSKKIQRGSALDFSSFLDAPAGKYGPVRPSPEGTLVFRDAPERRSKFFGVNLCFSANFLTKPESDRLAETLALHGYNSVRFHHHDTMLLDPKSDNSSTFNPETLDRLDYLAYSLKKRGIYFTSDIYSSRLFRPGDRLPECTDYKQRSMKALAPGSSAVRENWKAFARHWMLHRNPYTGLTWAEEPALIALNLINENLLAAEWYRYPDAVALYGKLYKGSGIADNSNLAFVSFLYDLQEKCIRELTSYLKDELKVQAMVTDLNNRAHVPMIRLRDKLELVDNHHYADHPSFPAGDWATPFVYSQRSSISDYASTPRGMMPTRIFGKPFIVTEFSYCLPNVQRAEGAAMIGAYAALQDWDGLYRFSWAHSADVVARPTIVRAFDTANDPLAQLSDRLSIALFLRGDVRPGVNKIAYRFDPEFLKANAGENFPQSFSRYGLVSRIGSVAAGAPSGVRAFKPEEWNPPELKAEILSDTGEIRLNPEQERMTVQTSRSEAVTLRSGSCRADRLAVKNADTFQSIGVVSLGTESLGTGKRLLVVHLTNVLNNKMKFADQGMHQLVDWGTLPLLLRKGRADVSLRLDGSSIPVVRMLLSDGSRGGTVVSEFRDGILLFRVDTAGRRGGVMAYEITR